MHAHTHTQKGVFSWPNPKKNEETWQNMLNLYLYHFLFGLAKSFSALLFIYTRIFCSLSLLSRIRQKRDLPAGFRTLLILTSVCTVSIALRHTSRARRMSPATEATFRAQNWIALGSNIHWPLSFTWW